MNAVELDPDFYGRCKLEKCVCLKPGNEWIGQACSNWEPIPGRMSAQEFSDWTNEKGPGD